LPGTVRSGRFDKPTGGAYYCPMLLTCCSPPGIV
jgi:hypothetical protein